MRVSPCREFNNIILENRTLAMLTNFITAVRAYRLAQCGSNIILRHVYTIVFCEDTYIIEVKRDGYFFFTFIAG
jgi:hypothetical protein